MPVPKKKILVSLYHSYIDTSSGAAVALRDLMEALAQDGWEVRVFCGPKLDFENPPESDQMLGEQGIKFKTYRAIHNEEKFRLHMFRSNGVDCGLWIPSIAQADPSDSVGRAWLSSYKEILHSWLPNMVVTYGGFWMFHEMMDEAKAIGAKRIFFLCNCAYTNREMFEKIDTTIVQSEFHSQWCHEVLGFRGQPLYPLIPPERYRCEPEPASEYVTFVNPHPSKGVYVFAKVAEILGHERPDIPFLVVEGRAGVNWLNRTGADLSQSNVSRMQNTPDPRDYLKVTRIMMVPSLVNETFGRVPAEAMLNGIPVIGSDRGALPEVIGDGGQVISIPDRISPTSRELPNDGEIVHWIEAIEKLWDDREHRDSASKRASHRSAIWSADQVVKQFEELFG